MIVRKATVEDKDRIELAFKNARTHMRNEGNVSQWAGEYPNFEDAKADIEKGQGFVVEDEDRVQAYFALIIGKDPTYSYIEDGKWLDDESMYGTIHRIASVGEKHGTFNSAVKYAFSLVDSVRIDTHKDNKTMLSLLEKLGFSRCGIIYVEDGTPREAFQKMNK